MQQTYKFNNTDFNETGFNKDGILFIDLVHSWVKEFHKEFYPFFANQFSGNYATMLLIKKCFQSNENEDFGIDGEFEFDEALKMEEFSERKTVFALASELEGNINEPLWLVMDYKLSDSTIMLKYVTDDDDGNDDHPGIVFDNRKKKQVKC